MTDEWIAPVTAFLTIILSYIVGEIVYLISSDENLAWSSGISTLFVLMIIILIILGVGDET